MHKLQIPSRDFAAYIFDCDGTIADTMPIHYESWVTALSEWRCSFPEDLFYAWAGRPTRTIVEMLNKRQGLSMCPDKVLHRKEELFIRSIPRVRGIPPVMEQLELHRGRRPMAVASGGYREAVKLTLSALGIAEHFDAIVTAEDCTRGKPDPEIFLIAAKRMGVPPEDCLVYEDAELGIQAAQAAGMQWVRVPSPWIAE